jgi:hypothetical protein
MLLDLAFADCVERSEEPHFLQVADERLQVFCGFDLSRDKRVSFWKTYLIVKKCRSTQLTRCDVSTCIWNCRLAVVLRSVLVTYKWC